MTQLPPSRIRPQNDASTNPAGDFVLYWMTAARRTRFNFGLEHAAALALQFRKPLVVLEGLRVDYPDASARLHRFVIDGMAANATAFKESRVFYYPYVEPTPDGGTGLIEALSPFACVVVTDWYPSYFLPKMLSAVAPRLQVAVEAVDSNGLIPVSEHGRAFPTARGYRAFLQRSLREHLKHFPSEHPLSALEESPRVDRLPATIARRWPATPVERLIKPQPLIATLAVDQSIQPVAMGGQDVATLTLQDFLNRKLSLYGDAHNDPDADCTSRLSPYLHFGHISAHEIFSALMTHERWTTRKLQKVRAGAREGWWGVSESAENFLDQIAVWRELAFNGCAWTPDYQAYDTLPAWARATLEAHLADPRPHIYSLEQLEGAETHDEVWNAAQRQLRSEGWFHGYMRMLWGKKILEWCRHPAEALDRMEVLMNRYSLDGRDPVSYLNYGWVLGRHDRPWPERPIFGTVRSMTSASAKRKLRMKDYLARFAR